MQRGKHTSLIQNHHSAKKQNSLQLMYTRLTLFNSHFSHLQCVQRTGWWLNLTVYPFRISAKIPDILASSISFFSQICTFKQAMTSQSMGSTALQLTWLHASFHMKLWYTRQWFWKHFVETNNKQLRKDKKKTFGRAAAEAIKGGAQIQSQNTPCRICDTQSGAGWFCPSTSVFPCQSLSRTYLSPSPSRAIGPRGCTSVSDLGSIQSKLPIH